MPFCFVQKFIFGEIYYSVYHKNSPAAKKRPVMLLTLERIHAIIKINHSCWCVIISITDMEMQFGIFYRIIF
jgi:hypothetical protein